MNEFWHCELLSDTPSPGRARGGGNADAHAAGPWGLMFCFSMVFRIWFHASLGLYGQNHFYTFSICVSTHIALYNLLIFTFVESHR